MKQSVSKMLYDQKKELDFRFKLYNHRWITEEHLNIQLNLTSSPQKTIMFCNAQKILRELTNRTFPDSVVKYSVFCFVIPVLVENCKNSVFNADDFLPVVIYIIIKTVPMDLLLNIDIITLFAVPSHVEIGENAYYFTTLMTAVKFIDQCTHSSFGLSQEEYFDLIDQSKTEIEQTIQTVSGSMKLLMNQIQCLSDKMNHFQNINCGSK
ncbi:Rab5 GDP/GTP exchange factor [Thelohanellus kitauei]|uniref:Rab5 GDP/GTP exchange factor n=1 Tax=Thelohanellus kitauei TaxID=669202 RepID=A0A0C2MR60_THEKT|nr:Rab5 GDP/GTP exchange factor [Thelohanellus kitauei]